MHNLWRRWRALWQPDMYHGWGRRRRYFEGWYFKMVAPDGQAALAVIPGISMAENGEQQAFIQLLDGQAPKAYYYPFPSSDFQASDQHFELQLANNYFSAGRLSLDLPTVKGELLLQQPHPWPKMLGAPGIMGWYSFVPFMECYHGVVSLHHQLEGQLELNGQLINFTGGTGYAEKDWGVSFPSSWIWMQSNHFDLDEPACLMVSVARIPWLTGHFVGFIAGFLFRGKLHRYATYTGAKLDVQLDDKEVLVTLTNPQNRLEVRGIPGEGGNLVSPIAGEMTGKVNESLQGQVHIRFWEKGELVFEGIGKHAGLEVAGDVGQELTNTF